MTAADVVAHVFLWIVESTMTSINNVYVFLGISALLVGYILYTMIRPRKGLRPGEKGREPEL